MVPNAYGPSTVSQMQNVTQADIGQRQGAEISSMLDDVGFSFIDIILGGFNNVVGAIGAAINKFISDLLVGLRNATGGLVDLTGFLKQTDVKANQAVSDASNALDKATLADAAAGDAAIVAANADSKAIAANNAAASAAALAATKIGKQDLTNLVYIYNNEDPAMRTRFPTGTVFEYQDTPGLAVSGTWFLSLDPALEPTLSYPTMPVGEDFPVTPGEIIYMEWRQRRVDANFSASLNLNGTKLDGTSAGYDIRPVTPSAAVTDNLWLTYAGTIVVPPECVKMSVQVKGLYTTTSPATRQGRWLFEEMVVRRAVSASAVQTADGTALDTKLVTIITNNDTTNALAVAAANEAQQALVTADIAYENAQYWKDECVVASAGVILGVNELVIGVVMDVPTGRTRKITDMHFALFSKPGSLSIETKVQSADGVTERVVHNHSIIPVATRVNVNNLDIDVADKERVFWNVTALGGTVPASVLQIALVGVLL